MVTPVLIGLCSVALLGSGLTVFLDVFVSPSLVPFCLRGADGCLQVLLQFFYYRTVERSVDL